MEQYRQMRNSGVPWILDIPESWGIRVLFQLADQVKNKNKDMSEQNLLSLSYGRIKRKDINSSDGLLPESFDGYNIIEANDIVLRLTDLQNDHTSLRVGQSLERGIITSAYTTLRPSSLVYPRYLYYVLHAYDLIKGFYGMGAGVRQGLNYDEVKTIKVPFPTMNEQKAIAAYLDDQVAQIDSIIAEAQASIEEYKQWKAAVVFEAITKGIDPNAPMRDSGISWIGKIPVGWTMCPIKRLTTKIGSGKTPSGGAEVYSDSGVLFLRSQNIYDTGLALDDVSHISDEIDNEMKNTRVEYKDVLLNITGGSIGRCCLYDLPDIRANVNQHVCILRTKQKELLPEFLRYFWNSSIGPVVVGYYQTGGNRQGLNFEQIGRVKVPLCSLETQKRIVDYLDKQCATINALIVEKQGLTEDTESYKRSMIYEVVTGKRKVV